MPSAAVSLLGTLLTVAVVAALVWDWYLHPDLESGEVRRRRAVRAVPAPAPAPSPVTAIRVAASPPAGQQAPQLAAAG